MKKPILTLMCLAAMMMASMSIKAQEVTIMLKPGWTWISYPSTDTVNFATALGTFTPRQGDVIACEYEYSEYYGGEWVGDIQQFYPGYGYMYYSSRSMPVFLTFNAQQPTPQVVVTTSEPTDITTNSATCGGNVASSDGNYVFVILRGICWSTSPNPTFNDNYIEAGNGLGSFTVSMTELAPYTNYYLRAFAVTASGTFYGNEVSFTSGHCHVDLGLPSGTLWATCNVGANSPEEYGDYFAWGETQPKDTYNWNTYQYCNGSNTTLTKYCNNSNYGYNGFADNLITLLPEDDAAVANWGAVWRTPTQAEWQELCQNTIQTFANQNGVCGWLFTASNGNSIFLPAAGYWSESDLKVVDRLGKYLSSSLSIDDPDKRLSFNFDVFSEYHMHAGYRYFGLSVRPVRSSGQNNAPTGAINGKFTINANGDQVYFSQGNLQYQASTDTWKFADNQYDYVFSDNGYISSTYSGWIDLFGWGTSSYNHGANCYQPWSTSQTHSDYYAYGSYTYNLYDQTGQADWGYNPISNGGNQTNQWRTLTQPEWAYVFNTRTTNSGIRYAKAKVNNVYGVILLPDDWNTSIYGLNNTNSNGASYSSNTLTASQWSTLEQAGAVFLPAAGSRYGSLLDNDSSSGCYWSASCSNSSRAYDVFFNDSNLFTSYSNRYGGLSVRLVRVAEN